MQDSGSTGSTKDALTNGRVPGERKTHRTNVDQQRVREPLSAQIAGLGGHLNTLSTDDFISHGTMNDTTPTGEKKSFVMSSPVSCETTLVSPTPVSLISKNITDQLSPFLLERAPRGKDPLCGQPEGRSGKNHHCR